MEIEKQDNQTAVVHLDEKVDIANSEEIKKRVLELIESSYNQVIIDFAEVDSIDSSGLGKLLLFHRKLADKGGKLKIINVTSDYIRKMFAMIHLNEVLEIEGV